MAGPASLFSRQAWVWAACAAAMLVAPLVFTSNAALTLLTQMAYSVIICLSFNLLLGQGGMLSFGHAVYSGVGAYAVIHALKWAGQGGLSVPVSLMPLLGGLAAAAVALLLGWPTTRRSGTAFAMITLGVGELVHAASQMFTSVFGGEAGVSANRVVGQPVLGISFATQREVFGLAAVYCLGCSAALYGFTRTPLGRMLEAARDNPLRVAFVGYSAHQLRYRAFVISGFFAGVGGGLSAINFENVTAESLGSLRSASILLFTVLGGTAVFHGPVVGGVLWVSALLLLSDLTRAWQVYTGLAFVLVVMFAPGGVAGLMTDQASQLAQPRPTRSFVVRRRWRVLATLPLLLCLTALLEMVYHHRLDAAMGSAVVWGPLTLDTASAMTWAAVLGVVVLTAALAARAWRSR